jgi:hypothetical protein
MAQAQAHSLLVRLAAQLAQAHSLQVRLAAQDEQRCAVFLKLPNGFVASHRAQRVNDVGLNLPL